MQMTFIVAILGVCFFITTVNCYFQKSKYKYLTKESRKKLNIFNSPTAWMSYSIVIAIIIGTIFCTSFISMTVNFSKVSQQQNDLINQQNQTQTDSSQQSTDSSQQSTNSN